MLLENEKRSLQNSLEQLVSENSKLTRRVNETDNTLANVRTRLEQVETALATSENERNKLTAAVDEANERRQSESNTLNMRLEAMQSRASAAEKLLGEVRQSLIARTEENRLSERKVVEATIAQERHREEARTAARLAAGPGAPDPRSRRLAHHPGGALQRADQDRQEPRNRARPRRGAGPGAVRPDQASWKRTPRPTAPRPRSASKSSAPPCSARRWSARSPTARSKRPARTTPNCSASWRRSAADAARRPSPSWSPAAPTKAGRAKPEGQAARQAGRRQGRADHPVLTRQPASDQRGRRLRPSPASFFRHRCRRPHPAHRR